MSTVAIEVANTDITSVIEYRSAYFESQVNGQVGPCQFRVKDTPRTRAFIAGDPITLDIDGTRVWTGWAMKIRRVYYLPVIGTTNATRYFLIDGADVNLLLQKRVVFNQTDPTLIKGPEYIYEGNPVSDLTALGDLFSDWLDLSGDGLDTSTLVEHVGNINVDQDANPFGASNTWANALASIAAVEGAIFYIDPDKNLVYTDVDTPNASFALSDAPTGGKVGYRSAEVFYDGASLINDMIVWGTGKGADNWVVNRTQDSASQTAHGVWQAGEVRFDLYRQASIDKRANTIVYGSPNNKRGRKDDKISVRCKIKEPGLRVAQKVDFESLVHDYADILPVRRMRTTFASPTDPLYELDLSHEVDVPFDFRDPLPPLTIDPIDLIDLGVLDGLELIIPGECDCGITDTFTRTITAAKTPVPGPLWGTSDSSLVWEIDAFWDGSSDATGAGVSNGAGFMELDQGPDGNAFATLPSVPALSASHWKVSFKVKLRDDGYHFGGSSGYCALRVSLGTADHVDIFFLRNGSWDVDWPAGNYAVTGSTATWFLFEWEYDSSVLTSGFESMRVRMGVDGSDPTWSSWEAYGSWGPLGTGHDFELRMTIGSSPSGDIFRLDFDDVDILDVNRCTEYRFDNFNRTETGQWGDTPDAYTWFTLSSPLDLGVSGGEGWVDLVSPSDIGIIRCVPEAANPWTSDFEMTALLKYSTGLQINDDLSFMFYMEKGSNVYVQLYLAGMNNLPSVLYVYDGTFAHLDSYDIPSANPIQGTPIWLKWKRVSATGQLQAKVWWGTDVEPDWQVDTTASNVTGDAGPTDGFVAQWSSSNSVGTRRMSMGYIDFDYAGKPCYQICDGITDTFTRTVSSGWGTSDSNIVWDEGASNASSASVNGSTGLIAYAPNLTVWPVLEQGQQMALEPSSATTSGQLVIRQASATFVSCQLLFVEFSSESEGEIILGMGTGSISATDERNRGGCVQLYDTTLGWQTAAYTWGTNAHNVKWELVDTAARVKVWAVGDSEPGTWTLEVDQMSYAKLPGVSIWYLKATEDDGTSNGYIPGTVDYAGPPRTEFGYHGNETANTIYVDDLDITGVLGCRDVGPASGSISTMRCIDVDADGGTVYVVAPYAAGTSEVYINGLMQRRNIDYTESNPLSGEITFTQAVLAPDVIRLCGQRPDGSGRRPGNLPL